MPEASIAADVLTTSAQTRLRSFVERITLLEEDKAAVANDIKEVMLEAKGEGYCTKTLRKVVRILKQDKAKRQEDEAMLDLYMHAVQGDLFNDTKASVCTGGKTVFEGTVGDMKRAAERLDA